MTSLNLFPYSLHLTAQRVEKGPVIDGYLNDEIWQLAQPFTNFKMVEPETGKEPSEKTELRVLYDKKNLYVGVYCYTSDPSGIAVTNLQHDQSARRDSVGSNDLVRVLLDPFQDKRNAYLFAVNAGGGRTEGLTTGGEHFQTDWDGIWDAKTKRVQDGWTAEFKIPFKTISFNPKLKEWGFNVERIIPRKIEIIRLSAISKDTSFYNPAKAALLGGIENIKQGKGITFIPYATMEMSRDYEGHQKREWKLNGGFDLYKNFTPNLVGVLTYHTDFAETEVDDRQINLTRFPLYYKEKRSFFLEGSEIFSFESNGGFRPAFIPFFSRRIGLHEGEQVPVDWGLKMYGKIGRTNLALLDVKTRAYNGFPAENFLAGRIYQNIFSESKVGIIFTSGEPGSDDSNTLFGIDFRYATSRMFKNKNAALSGWWVTNHNKLTEGKHYGYGLAVSYPNDLLDFNIGYKYLGDALEPGLGFLPRSDVQQLDANFKFRPRPRKGLLGKLVRQMGFETYWWVWWDLQGNLESLRASVAPMTTISTESGERLEFFFITHREVLPVPFEVAENVIIPVGDYTYYRYQYLVRTASHRKAAAEVKYETGGFYSGKMSQWEVKADFSYKANVRLGLEGIFIRGNLPEGKFKETIYRAKTDFYLNPDLGLLTYIQYDSVSKVIGANFRFRWQLSPGNTIYFVYNKNWERGFDKWSPHAEQRFYPLHDRGIFKIQLSVRP
jgi:hypothetical protein